MSRRYLNWFYWAAGALAMFALVMVTMSMARTDEAEADILPATCQSGTLFLEIARMPSEAEDTDTIASLVFILFDVRQHRRSDGDRRQPPNDDDVDRLGRKQIQPYGHLARRDRRPVRSALGRLRNLVGLLHLVAGGGGGCRQ